MFRVWFMALLVAISCESSFAWQEFLNNSDSYGRLNQRTLDPSVIPGRPLNLGSYACGPVAFVNSLFFLQVTYPDVYESNLVPDSNADGLIDVIDLNHLATRLAQAALSPTLSGMDAQPGSAFPDAPYSPDDHGAVSGIAPGFGAGGV